MIYSNLHRQATLDNKGLHKLLGKHHLNSGLQAGDKRTLVRNEVHNSWRESEKALEEIWREATKGNYVILQIQTHSFPIQVQNF